MSVTPLAATSVACGAPQTDTIPNASQTLDQKDFLQLLVTQMQYQDPLNPQSDTQMAAQMAQFTALQQSSAMSGSLAMIQANALVGNTVTVQIGTQSTASGMVQGVIMQNGSPQIVINGSQYSLSQVVSVAPTVSSSSSSSSSPTSTTTPTSATTSN